MKFINQPLTKKEIETLQKTFGNYVKLTVDIENEWVVAGSELHADAEKLLLDKGSKQDYIWGGGINLKDKQIDTTAVLNLRPRLGNDNLEILDPEKRGKFIDLIKNYFQELWR